MSSSVLDLICGLPVEIVVTYAYTLFLPMRRVKLFWVVRMTLCIFGFLARPYFGVEFRVFFGLVMAGILIPLLFSHGKMTSRLLSIALLDIVLLISEFTGSLIWTALTGEININYDLIQKHIGIYWLTHLFHLFMYILMLSMLYAITKKLVGDRASGNVRYFALFPIAQLLLICFIVEIKSFYLFDSASFTFGGIMLISFCILVDILLFIALNQYSKKELEDQRAAALNQQLDRYLQQYDDVVAGMERTAKIKHDLRNQLHVVMYLTAQGDIVQAGEHLGAMRAFVEPPASDGRQEPDTDE